MNIDHIKHPGEKAQQNDRHVYTTYNSNPECKWSQFFKEFNLTGLNQHPTMPACKELISSAKHIHTERKRAQNTISAILKANRSGYIYIQQNGPLKSKLVRRDK